MATKIMRSRVWPFGITWRHWSRDHSTRGGWLPIGGPIVTMRLSSTVLEIWPFEVLPERLFQEQRSVVGRSIGLQYYTDLVYFSSLRYGVFARSSIHPASWKFYGN